MGLLENEIQALRIKQLRIEKKQQKDNDEVWQRIQTLELIALENSGVDAGKMSSSVMINASKIIQKRGIKHEPKNKNTSER